MPEDALKLARTLRAGLRDAVTALEDAAAAPAARTGWRDALNTRVHDVRRALITHIDEVESAGGLLDLAEAAEPSLAPAAALIRDHHGVLCEEVDQVLDLMRMISQHRQQGADLVYAAWQVEAGGT